jgi:hypothetical protein
MEFAEDGEFTVHSPKGWTRSSMPEHAEATVFRSLGSREASYG